MMPFQSPLSKISQGMASMAENNVVSEYRWDTRMLVLARTNIEIPELEMPPGIAIPN